MNSVIFIDPKYPPMRKAILTFLIALPLALYSQKPPIKFGDVSLEELKMTRYDKDTSASAFVIADYGDSRIEYNTSSGFYIRFERLRRIKIFKKDAYSFADFSFPLYHSNKADEKLASLKASTYNLEGGKKVETKMKNDAIFKEKVDKNVDQIKITLPNVKEGSVIEISYETSSEFLFNFQDWEFQSTIPVKWSEYRARIPQYFDYQKYMQGYVTAVINEEKQSQDAIRITTAERGSLSTGSNGSGTTFDTQQIDFVRHDYRWVATDVPAFAEEPYMNNTVDYISKINFELATIQMPNKPAQNFMNTWENLNTEFLDEENFGGVVNGSSFLNSITKDVTEGISDPVEKTAKIYAYVKSNIEWNGEYRKHTNDGLKKVLENKKGNSAELNLTLVSMFKKAGLNSNPVLISTRNHGFIRKQFPLSSQFNYVICSVTLGDKLLLLDATDRSLPMNVLPERCLNNDGFVISKENSGWINITPNFKSRTITNFDLTLNESGEMTGMISISREGYDAQRMRKSFITKGEEKYKSDLAASYKWELEKSKFDNTSELNAPVIEEHIVKVAEHIQVAGDVMYLNPLIMGQTSENPFKADSRIYPVDFGSPFEQVVIGRFTIPAGYSIEETPKPKRMLLVNSTGKFAYSLTLNGDKIQFTSQLVINKPLFSQEEYPDLREFYNQVLAKQAEQIVLKKK